MRTLLMRISADADHGEFKCSDLLLRLMMLAWVLRLVLTILVQLTLMVLVCRFVGFPPHSPVDLAVATLSPTAANNRSPSSEHLPMPEVQCAGDSSVLLLRMLGHACRTPFPQLATSTLPTSAHAEECHWESLALRRCGDCAACLANAPLPILLDLNHSLS